MLLPVLMNAQSSWSQMEQRELISYETNLVACYEAEYLLSVQYKTNCQCSDHHHNVNSSLGHTETMKCNPWDGGMEIEMMQVKKNENESEVENFNTRKRPHHIHTYNCETNMTKQPEKQQNDKYSYREHNNSLMVVTGQLSIPHGKRMCFETLRCQS